MWSISPLSWWSQSTLLRLVGLRSRLFPKGLNWLSAVLSRLVVALRSPDKRASPALLQLLRANAGPALHVRLGRADAAHSEKCLVSSGLEPLCDVLPLRVVLKQGGCSKPSPGCLSLGKPGPAL